MDGRTEDRAWPSYKLTFGSGELKMREKHEEKSVSKLTLLDLNILLAQCKEGR